MGVGDDLTVGGGDDAGADRPTGPEAASAEVGHDRGDARADELGDGRDVESWQFIDALRSDLEADGIGVDRP